MNRFSNIFINFILIIIIILIIFINIVTFIYILQHSKYYGGSANEYYS
jgi:hypothetical protein